MTGCFRAAGPSAITGAPEPPPRACAPDFRPSWCRSSAISSSGGRRWRTPARGRSRSRSPGSTTPRSPRPSTRAGGPRCVSGPRRSARGWEKSTGWSSSCGRYTASSRRQPCAAQPIRIISPPSTAIRATRASAQACVAGARGASDTPVPLCRLERASAPPAGGRAGRADGRRRQSAAGRAGRGDADDATRRLLNLANQANAEWAGQWDTDHDVSAASSHGDRSRPLVEAAAGHSLPETSTRDNGSWCPSSGTRKGAPSCRSHCRNP